MLRTVYTLILGLVGAGIVHIAIIMMLPMFSERDAWSRLAEAGELYAVVPLDAGQKGAPVVARSVDPLFEARACRFDLQDGLLHVGAVGSVPFWSVSIYDRGGQNIYSFNDRTSSKGSLDFVVVTPLQMVEIRKDLPPEFEQSVFVEADLDEGIVVVRGFVPDASQRPTVSGYLDAITCSAG